MVSALYSIFFVISIAVYFHSPNNVGTNLDELSVVRIVKTLAGYYDQRSLIYHIDIIISYSEIGHSNLYFPTFLIRMPILSRL